MAQENLRQMGRLPGRGDFWSGEATAALLPWAAVGEETSEAGHPASQGFVSLVLFGMDTQEPAGHTGKDS